MHSLGSLVFYEEYKFGHLSFLIPKSLKIVQDVVNLVKTFNPIYVPASSVTRDRSKALGKQDPDAQRAMEELIVEKVEVEAETSVSE